MINVKKIRFPRYFPKTITVLLVGVVIRNSIVPVAFSSAKLFMVSNGMIKINRNSMILKISFNVAS